MNTKEYIERITNYIFGQHNTRALLIDGEWGCGKSYFVKNSLIPYIKTIQLKDDSSIESQKYIPVYVSLFGVSSIASIQEAIYSSFMEATFIDDKNEKTKAAVRNICLFGSKIATGVGNFFNVGEDVNAVGNSITEQIFHAKKEQIVLIFDDFERCQVDIIELMGFLNNLCENNEYKLIIISNEKEISIHENSTALAIQKQVSLLDLHFNSKQIEDNQKSSGLRIQKAIIDASAKNGENTRNDAINQHMLELFEKDKQYETTREKLIGLTIRYNPALEDVYEQIARKFATDDEHYELLISYKDNVVSSLDSIDRKSLRTLGAIFICIESIFDCFDLLLDQSYVDDCQKYEVNINEIDLKVKNEVIHYIVKTACEYSTGTPVYNWPDESRYGLIDFETQSYDTYFGFAFVDEYWQSLFADKEKINHDFNNRVVEIIADIVSRKKNSVHYDLALYKLSSWDCWNQETVSSLLEQLKRELSCQKYKANEFKDIIVLLMRINDPQIGMYSGLLGEDEKAFEIDKEKNQVLLYGKPFFELVDVSEYVDLMLNYFEDTSFLIDKQMLEFFSTNSSKVDQYCQYIKPIINKIEDEENRTLKVTECGNSVFDNIDDDLFNFLKSKHDSYIRKRQFFSIYGYDFFYRILIQNNSFIIRQLSETISSIYNINNLKEFFIADLEVVEKLHSSLAEDRVKDRKIYNANLDRDKEMWLREIEVKLYDYLLKFRA